MAKIFMDCTYDNIGQLKTAQGFEQGGTQRLQEQFAYAWMQVYGHHRSI